MLVCFFYCSISFLSFFFFCIFAFTVNTDCCITLILLWLFYCRTKNGWHCCPKSYFPSHVSCLDSFFDWPRRSKILHCQSTFYLFIHSQHQHLYISILSRFVKGFAFGSQTQFERIQNTNFNSATTFTYLSVCPGTMAFL